MKNTPNIDQFSLTALDVADVSVGEAHHAIYKVVKDTAELNEDPYLVVGLVENLQELGGSLIFKGDKESCERGKEILLEAGIPSKIEQL